ncbi:hypothetical protein CBS101457_006665 [Exobasidium rhododendri]|nr:hypothetical protein CBS101457_006665 [Exobasidium rhododendri]
MRNSDAFSIYSTSTLVGGGEDEARDEVNLRRSMARRPPHHMSLPGNVESRYQRYPQVDLSRFGDQVVGRSTLSRQGSLTTLHDNQSSSTRRRNYGNHSRISAPTPRPRIASVSESLEIEESDLQVPWWSPILPTPVVGRNKSSSGRSRLALNTQASDRAPLSITQSTLTPSMATPSGSSQPTDYSQLSQKLSVPPRPANTMQKSSSSGSGLSPSRRDRNANEQSPPRKPTTGTSLQFQMDTPIPPPMPATWPLYARCYCEENAYLLAAYLFNVCQSYNEREANKSNEFRIRWEVDVIVVSNKNQTVLMREQRAVEEGVQVMWDYHVFVVVSCQVEGKTDATRKGKEPAQSSRSSLLSKRNSDTQSTPRSERVFVAPFASWVYDLDSRQASPTPLATYLSATSGLKEDVYTNVLKRHRPVFRVVPATTYFTRFGSDRSHMKRPSTTNPSRDAFEWAAPRPEWDLILGSKAHHSATYFMDSFVDMRVRIGDGRFGFVVQLEDLMKGAGLMMERAEVAETCSTHLAAGVAVLLERVEEVGSERQGPSVAAPKWTRFNLPEALEEENEEVTSPGFLIGNVRHYGIRPPPPPPGEIVPPVHRGKRVTDPLFPAYMLSVFEHRAAKARTSMILSRDTQLPA